MKNFLNYSKFVFFTRPAGGETQQRAPETPGERVDQSLTTLAQKQQAELKEKEEAAKKLRANKDKLHKAWMDSPPHGKKEIPDDNPAYLALKNVPGMDGKEAFALLSVVSKNSKLGGAAKADELYKACFEGGKFDIDKLRKFFTRDFGFGTLGFYYGTKKETKTTKRWYWSNKKTTITKTGWWAIDSDDKNGDDFSGEKSFLKAVSFIKTELSVAEVAGSKGGYNDSSLGVEEEKAMVEDLKKIDAEARGASNEVFAKDALDWLKANAKNGWTVLTPDIIGKFVYLFGEGCGKYQYRIYNEKVYCLRIPGQRTPADKKDAGYFDLKNGKLEAKWNDMDLKDLKTSLADNMSPVEIERELAAYKLESGTALAPEDKLNASKGLVSTITGLPHVEYENLDRDYLKKVKEGLEKKLKDKNIPDDKINDIAQARVDELKKNILDKINAQGNEALKKAVNEDGKIKIDIKVSDNDEVTVGFAEAGKKTEHEKAHKEKAEAERIAKEVTEKKAEFEKKIKKVFGPFAPLVMRIFKVEEGLKDIASGTKSKAAKTLGFIGGFFGINFAAKAIGSKRINQKDFDVLIGEGKTEHELDKKMILAEEITLNGKKIVIEKGKGIIPGGKLKVKITKENNQHEELELDKAVKAKKLFSFGLGGGEEEQHKDDEIVIESGTKIPKGTVIPAGAKIIKV